MALYRIFELSYWAQLSRFEPPNELEKLAESKSTTEHDNKPESSVSQSPREPRALSPLTSIWDSDDDEERRQSITPTHHTAGSNGTSPIHKRMPKRSRPRGSESPVDVNSSNPTGEGSAKRQRRSEPTPSESTPVEVTEFPVPRAPNRRDAKKSAKARTGAGAMMCHQCRSTNKWAKMSCTNAPETGPRCKRRYCANCIVKRFAPLLFALNSSSYTTLGTPNLFSTRPLLLLSVRAVETSATVLSVLGSEARNMFLHGIPAQKSTTTHRWPREKHPVR